MSISNVILLLSLGLHEAASCLVKQLMQLWFWLGGKKVGVRRPGRVRQPELTRRG